MDKFHFGNSPAAINLVDILSKSENLGQRRRASAFMNKTNTIFKAINGLKDRKIRKNLGLAWRNHQIQALNLLNFQDQVGSHLLTLVSTSYRKNITDKKQKP